MPDDSRRTPGPETEVDAPPPARSGVVMATAVRSVVILLSMNMLRERGHFARYRDLLDERHRDAVLGLVAGTWASMDTMLAHYNACERLRLPASEVIELGRGHTDRLHVSVFDVTLRLAGALGATPWTLAAQLHKYWQRTFRGGGLIVVRLGPKEGRLELVGYPCARIPYVRLAWRGALLRGAELVSSKVYVNDIPSMCNASTLSYRLSWV